MTVVGTPGHLARALGVALLSVVLAAPLAAAGPSTASPPGVVPESSEAAAAVPSQRAAGPALRARPNRPMRGERTAFSGKAPGVTGKVVLQRKAAGRWRPVATGRAQASHYRVVTRVRQGGTYRVRARGFTSQQKTIRLARQSATMAAVEAPFVLDLPRTVLATVAPKRAKRTVRLQALVGEGWQTIASARTRADGAARIAVTGTTPGSRDYRVVAAPYRGAAASPPSPVVAVRTARRLDVASAGTPDGSANNYAAVSADGRWVAFGSQAQLLPADDDLTYDIYLLDRTTGALEGVLLSSNGTTVSPSLSANGRFVAFQSQATDLGVGGDADWDVFVLDRRTGEVELISDSAGGGDGDGLSVAPTVSADGRYVAFVSTASNLVAFAPPPDTTVRHGWIHDRTTGVARGLDRVGIGWSTQDVDDVTISGDGTRIAFTSSDDGLDGPVATTAIFTWDVAADGALSERSQRTAGRDPALSADGDTLAFTSGDDLVDGDINGDRDAYVRPVIGGSITLASPAGSGEPSRAMGLSADGRYVLMTTREPLSGDGNGNADDTAVFDTATDSHLLVSRGGNAASLDPAMSADGSVVVFSSASTNLIGPAISGDSNTFVAVLR